MNARRMFSPLMLERPGRWRSVGMGVGFLLALFPLIAAIASLDSLGGNGEGALLQVSWLVAVGRSVMLGVAVCGVAVALGLPVGLLTAVYAIPGWRICLGLMALPLFVPSFLWSIGLSMLRIALGMPDGGVFSGFSGAVVVFSAGAVPLVVMVTLASVRKVSQAEADAVRMAGGEWRLLWYLARSVFPMALAVGMLAGILTVSDPGPGQILGCDGAASHILVSFAAQYDMAQATRQSLMMGGVVLALSVPLVWWLAPGMATALLVRQNKPIARVRPEMGAVLGLWVLLAGTVAAVLMPLAGLLHPLFSAREIPWDASLAVVARTWSDTVFLAVFAGGAGVLLGGGMALCAGRSRRRRAVLLAGSLVLVAMPPALSCMGVMAQASQTPPWLDFLMRSRLAVGAAEALRFFPVGVVLVMRSLGSASPEWAAAAAVHGVSLTRYLWRVLIPWILPGVVVGGLLIALLATADITAALLLTPPGGGTLPLAIFTVMANAPESLVATLCLMYVGGAALLMVIGVVLIMLSSRIRRV